MKKIDLTTLYLSEIDLLQSRSIHANTKGAQESPLAISQEENSGEISEIFKSPVIQTSSGVTHFRNAVQISILPVGQVPAYWPWDLCTHRYPDLNPAFPPPPYVGTAGSFPPIKSLLKCQFIIVPSILTSLPHPSPGSFSLQHLPSSKFIYISHLTDWSEHQLYISSSQDNVCSIYTRH